jgi:thiol-disulfide isomerase/thioredoxin
MIKILIYYSKKEDMKKKCFNTNNILLISIVAIIITLIFIYFLQYKGIVELFSDKTTTIEYYSSSRCGHCKSFNPVWNQFVEKMDGEIEFKQFTDKEATDRADEIGFDLVGFPSIVKVRNDKLEKEFTGQRTLENLTNFL